ncbi:hypothetical protein TRVA0_044S00540 [Trichomonascus vanleenenianus]|uniref:epoxide hydrolase n=1 Tax=Trichomonascus vanleenenianus TaxID=2268995 RepID=UPI003ECACBE5
MSTQIKQVTLPKSQIKVFYRENGPKNAPVVLLLHGFPTSSHQYRNLIPLLAKSYRVIAPDLPGFGFTEVPESLNFQYTFANLTATVADFLDELSIKEFAVYIFDYGAPTGLRLALQRPSAVKAIVSQNGNAYEEGLSAFWDPVREFWAGDNSAAERNKLKSALLTFDATKWQYDEGTKDPSTVAPESYWLDYTLLQRPGNDEIQIDLFKDYENNVKLYPEFHKFFRKSQVPILATWGKHDPIFAPPGAEGFKKDAKDVEVHILDAGHMAVESNTEEIAGYILDFFKRIGY